jgi:hypothetical protein
MGKVIVSRRTRLLKRDVPAKPSEYKAHARALTETLKRTLLRLDLDDEVRAVLQDSLKLCWEVSPIARRPGGKKLTYALAAPHVYRLGPDCKSNHELHVRVMEALGAPDANGKYPFSLETVRSTVQPFYTIYRRKVPS